MKTRQHKDKILIGLDQKMKLDCKGHNKTNLAKGRTDKNSTGED